MKRIFIILFLSLLVSGVGIDDIYAAKSKAKSSSKKKVTRPTTSKIKKKEKKKEKPAETAEQKKKRLAKKNKKDTTKTSLTRPASSSVIKKGKNKTGTDSKTVQKLNPAQKSAVDKKLAKHKALKGKTFKSKKEAETAYRNSLASQKYDKRPDTRPDNIPNSYTHNGRRVDTDFYDGQYGVYTSPGIFRPYTATDFLIDAMVINALTTPRVQTVQTTPVVVERPPTNENDSKITMYILIFLGFLIICGVGTFLIFNRKSS